MWLISSKTTEAPQVEDMDPVPAVLILGSRKRSGNRFPSHRLTITSFSSVDEPKMPGENFGEHHSEHITSYKVLPTYINYALL